MTQAPIPPETALSVRKTGRILYVTAVVLLCAWVLVPLYFLLINTLSAPATVNSFPKPFFPEFDLGSLRFFAGFGGMLDALRNSLLVASMTMVMAIAIGAPAGYALSRFEFRGKEMFRLLILLTRAFPLPLLALPLAVMFIRTGLDDTTFGLALVHTTLAIPFSVLITYSLFSGIPVELEEAAWTLGCTRFHSGFRQGGAAAHPSGHHGLSDIRLRDLLERGFRRSRPDDPEPDTDRLPPANLGGIPHASEIRGRLHPRRAGADLHLRRAQIPLRHVGHREPLGRGASMPGKGLIWQKS